VALLLRLPHRFPLQPLYLQPGDAVVFHCLTLHRSGPNASGRRRYALNITYNARDNLPVALPPPLPTTNDGDDGDDDDDDQHHQQQEQQQQQQQGQQQQHHHQQQSLTDETSRPPPLPYAIVGDDADVVAGGTCFDPADWGVPPIPREVHELLERWRDGDGDVDGDVVGEVVGARVEEVGVLVFGGEGLTEEVKAAVVFKCRALKLPYVYRAGEGKPPKERIEVFVFLPPPPASTEG
jgi:hypothetical protein